MSEEKDLILTEEEDLEATVPTVVLTLDDDSEIECDILEIFKVEEQEYIALLPRTEDPDNTDVYLFRFHEDEEGEPVIENIETDREYEEVTDAFNAIMEKDYEGLEDEDFEEEEFEK